MNFGIVNFGTCTWDKHFSVKGPLSQSNVYIYIYGPVQAKQYSIINVCLGQGE